MTTTLKQRLATPRPLLAPGVYDALTALVAEQAGFEALYLLLQAAPQQAAPLQAASLLAAAAAAAEAEAAEACQRGWPARWLPLRRRLPLAESSESSARPARQLERRPPSCPRAAAVPTT